MRKDQRRFIVTEQEIKQEWKKVDSVTFIVGSCVRVVSRVVKLGDIPQLLPLSVVFSALDISPQDARPVFTTLSQSGLATLDTYEDLGAIHITPPPFQEISALLGKRIEVVEDAGGNIYRHLFTALPSKEIFEIIDAY